MAWIYRLNYFVIFCFIIFNTSYRILAFSCHAKCNCIWRKGKPTAECPAAGFEKIPLGLDSDVHVLDLTRNNFTILPPNAFLNAGLVHLQRVYLSRCGIEHIDDFALNRISNLVELDLSDNLISYVPTAAFRHLPLLRHLILNGNPLTIIPSQAFVELKTLIILELSNCKIDTVASRAFEGLQKLEVLKLDSNELQTLHARTILHLDILHGITLDGNPWTCDCELRGLRQWLDTNNVPYISPVCYKPLRLREKIWTEVELEDYACPPTFLNTSSAMNVLEGSNVTLDCKVAGDPIPTVQWIWRERIIANLSEGISSIQSFLVAEYSDKEKISRLKISSVQEPNAGIYTCVAENTAGKVSKNFTLMVSRMPATGVKVIEEEKTQEVKEEDEDRGNHVAGMAIGMISGAIIVLALLLAVLWICHKKRQRNVQRKQRIDANHKVNNSVNTTAPKGPQEDTVQKLPNMNSTNTRMGPYEGLSTNELDHYDPVMIDSTLSPQVWMVQDHMSHSNVDWDTDPNTAQCILPNQQVLIERRSRSPIPMSMPIPPEDIHVRLHNELSDALRKKCEHKGNDVERERGDGSSEMEAIDAESIKLNFEPHPLPIREDERSIITSRISAFLPDKCIEGRGPDLIDHALRDALADDIDDWQNSTPQPWIYDQTASYYRSQAAQMKNITTSSRMGSDGESTATEV